ncbi:MAG: single-stranded DNA-specific exonuclease [Thermoplasmata archaeon]|nr:single-stranded DNA-specific exonuclease [Thermoplasmata archaeon]
MSRLIIHHWDTDGICSASMLYEEGNDNISPKIGNYFLDEGEIEWIADSSYDEIWVVDVALHEETMKKLAGMAKVKVFDHHLTKKVDGVEYINPIIEGKGEEDYPSASWVVAEYMGKTNNLLAFLGAVGDWEERIKNTSFYPRLEKFMEESGLNFEQMHEMVYIIDANYKAGDKEEVERAVRMLHNASNPADFIMKNEKWRRRKEDIEREIEKAIDAEEKRIGNVKFKEIDSPYNIISTVARRIWDGKNYVVVVNRRFFRDKCQVYVRGENAIPLIKMAVERGYVAGGKKNVMGAIVPEEECDEFVEKIIEVIK